MTKQIPAAEVEQLAREIRCDKYIRDDKDHIIAACSTWGGPTWLDCANCKTRRELLRLCGEE